MTASRARSDEETSGSRVGHPGAAGLQRDGFVVLPSLLSDAEVAGIRSELVALLDGVEPGWNAFAGQATRRHHYPFAATRALDPLAMYPVVSSLLDQILGPERQFAMTVVTSIEGYQPAQRMHYDAGV